MMFANRLFPHGQVIPLAHRKCGR